MPWIIINIAVAKNNFSNSFELRSDNSLFLHARNTPNINKHFQAWAILGLINMQSRARCRLNVNINQVKESNFKSTTHSTAHLTYVHICTQSNKSLMFNNITIFFFSFRKEIYIPFYGFGGFICISSSAISVCHFYETFVLFLNRLLFRATLIFRRFIWI